MERAFDGMWLRAIGAGPTRWESRRMVRAARNSWIDFADAPPALVGIVEGEPGRFRVSRAIEVQAASARKSLWIATAYFIPAFGVMESLKGAARDGVDVRVLVPDATTTRGSTATRAATTSRCCATACASGSGRAR